MNCRNVLGRTLGVPLFQEQAMQIAMVAAEFSDTEANGLRKAMATFRSRGTDRAQFEQHDGRAHGGTRGYKRELRRALLQPDQGVRRVRLSRKPCGELCPAGLYLGLDQALLSGGVRLRRCSIPSRWGSTPRPRSWAMRVNHGVDGAGPPTSMPASGTIRLEDG
jgi:hypothetical protein